MPPKKSTTPSKAKAAPAAPTHGSYIDMVKDAIVNLKDRNGSSRQAIQKYIQANNKVGNLSDSAFRGHVNRAIASGEEKGDFARPKGTSGPVKLAKKEAKPASATTTKKAEPKAEKKTAEKKAPATKKATTTKAKATTKAAPKKAAAPKKTGTVGPPKKATTTAAAKPKANASKPRKTAPAPAVEEEVSRVLGKTKSGRVTKTKAPAAATTAPKATTKKAPAARKTATASKASTPKKKATPKKATPKAKA
ncbi:hypothetical protein BDW02DRAFT_572908 [Decorospora gaudefroyi]|uniref:Histone H1 n=1 Tax=Decorospora gaudefroyi TaxID=184978 RepID=A0A6A5K3A5_9PLEO|nr:hypothetical protein BDW02DRAFT_572908 [Decorospora gaudefroyi]